MFPGRVKTSRTGQRSALAAAIRRSAAFPAGTSAQSAIQGVLPFPFRQVTGVGIPFRVLHRAIELDETVAEIAAQRFALLDRKSVV